MTAATGVAYAQLMAYAHKADDVMAHALAGAVSTAFSQGVFPALYVGLSENQFRCLLDRYFPNAWRELFANAALLDDAAPCPAFREEEIKDLVELLLEHRARDKDESSWLAYVVSTACMGNNHLWQDLGLTNRQALSDLLEQNFGSLYARNTGNMKWKKFFYKQLCDRAEVNLCKAPSCQVCVDYKNCFGPEDGSALQVGPAADAARNTESA